MEKEKQLPRLTRYLRAFTNLEPRKQRSDNAFPNTADHSSEKEPFDRVYLFLWSDLWITIEKHSCMTPIVKKKLEILKTMAKDICGEQRIVGDTAIYLFQLFMQKPKALNNHCSSLKLLYSNISYNHVAKICELVNEIVTELSEECIASINDKLNKPLGNKPLAARACKMWGDHIKFHIPQPWIPPDTSFLSDLTQEQNITESFSMVYNESGDDLKKKSENKKSFFGKSWMVKEIEKCNISNGLTTEEICNSVTSLLTSNRSNDALQNELFDFLGFDNFEFIQSLLEHRKEICMSNKLDEKRKNSGPDNKQKPFVTTVTVKSQEEIYLEKQARKENKKLTKFAAKEARTTKDEPQIPEERFDPLELRAKRIAALTGPATNDFNTENKKVAVRKEVYPHVYDSLSVVQQQCGLLENEPQWIKVKTKRSKKKK